MGSRSSQIQFTIVNDTSCITRQASELSRVFAERIADILQLRTNGNQIDFSIAGFRIIGPQRSGAVLWNLGMTGTTIL